MYKIIHATRQNGYIEDIVFFNYFCLYNKIHIHAL
jgi:hypothetical protein